MYHNTAVLYRQAKCVKRSFSENVKFPGKVANLISYTPEGGRNVRNRRTGKELRHNRAHGAILRQGEILTPGEQSEDGRRLYSEDDRRKLQVISILRETDMPIGLIAQILGQNGGKETVGELLSQ